MKRYRKCRCACEAKQTTAWLGRQDSKLCIPNDRTEPEEFRSRLGSLSASPKLIPEEGSAPGFHIV
jgi:hypothetical protein